MPKLPCQNLRNYSNMSGTANNQAYPDAYPDGDHPAQTGAAEINTLGYSFYGDSVYQLSFTFPHSESSLVLEFSASGLQNVEDESWGLDNVEVQTTDPQQVVYANDFEGLLGWEWLPEAAESLDCTVRYFRGTVAREEREITDQVNSQQGWRRRLGPGQNGQFLITVTPHSGLEAGQIFQTLVRAEARRDPSQRDTIKTVTQVK